MILATKLARLVLFYKSSLELNTMVIIYNVRCLKHHGDNLQCKMQLCKFVNDAQSGKNSCIYLWKLCSTTTLLIMVFLANRPKNSKSATSKTSNENDKKTAENCCKDLGMNQNGEIRLLLISTLSLATNMGINILNLAALGQKSSWQSVLTSPPASFFAVSLFDQVGNLSFSWTALHL